MMDYNGAEKGCSGTKGELVIELAALPDRTDANCSGEKKFTIIRRFYVEYDRLACCPSIAGQPPNFPESPLRIMRYAGQRSVLCARHRVCIFIINI